MIDSDAASLLQGGLEDGQVLRLLEPVGFSDPAQAYRRLAALCPDEPCRQALAQCLPMLLSALADAATPDGSLINFERYVQSVPDRLELFRYLADNPRGVEILIRLFVGSQFLTEILLRNPDYLQRLTAHKRLAEFKSREDFFNEALAAAGEFSPISEKLDALRRYQHWELLRIGACDSFGLFDLKSVTVQLSLLADSLVQAALALLSVELNVPTEGFVVLAFGKLGGEELNYSSDIDLVFLAEQNATAFWGLGQRLIKALQESTAEGFLYRVDMRLRPWGRSGALVNTVDAHLEYLQKHGMLWEKQAMLKARPIAGDFAVGERFLARVRPLIFGTPIEILRENVRQMKQRIEDGLQKQGRRWGEVKSGQGSIRDIEFVTQFLQLARGGEHPEVLSINTLDGLVRLADFGFLPADEYRQLASGYVFLRTVEHALQLMHYKQTHSLPTDRRELAYLARRLDYPGADEFVAQYQRHCEAIRAIYDRHFGESTAAEAPASVEAPRFEHLARLEASYKKIFTEEEIARHAALLERLSDETVAVVEAAPRDGGLWQVTVVGFDYPGDLSVICGLLFVHGFDIVDGQAFSDEHVPAPAAGTTSGRAPGRFVDVFTVRPGPDVALPDVWIHYERDLRELLRMIAEGRPRDAQGELAKRVAAAVREVPGEATLLYPVEVEIDNDSSERMTVLRIRSEDTIGFLYELSNALALTGIDISRVIIQSQGQRVFDTLYVTDARGMKIVDPQAQKELRAAVVLIKHFTHLLPRSGNPEAALLHFREFLEQLFQRPDWVQELSTLERSEVLEALARLLGVSDFLWEDFLRLQHENLFPVVRDLENLARGKPKAQLAAELDAELAGTDDPAEQRSRLNAFKDREMFRADMRHILGHVTEFGEFSDELTAVAEVVVAGALRICEQELQSRFGRPLLDDGRTSALSICALGKFGGRELGFASDIELMFVYEDNGRTEGPEPVTNTEYFIKLVETFTQIVQARREGIFQIDLRLRPYGRAGSLAVSLDAFRSYFAPDGPAWPYERQALVKLRPVAGDEQFGGRVVRLRDELIYTGERFDATSMRAMREKQVRQLVQPGSLNAKLSPGGLVDCEYLVQGLQITHGRRTPPLRTTNTLEALDVLRSTGLLSSDDYRELRDSYIFLRRLIDALRMVRGHARDLTVPAAGTEEFEFLARRLGYGGDADRLAEHIDQAFQSVRDLTAVLDRVP